MRMKSSQLDEARSLLRRVLLAEDDLEALSTGGLTVHYGTQYFKREVSLPVAQSAAILAEVIARTKQTRDSAIRQLEEMGVEYDGLPQDTDSLYNLSN